MEIDIQRLQKQSGIIGTSDKILEVLKLYAFKTRLISSSLLSLE